MITGAAPEDVQALIACIAEPLRPVGRDQVTRSSDTAAFLMARVGRLDHTAQHQKLRHQDPPYHQDSLKPSIVRVGEVFRAALKLNAAALIVVHNHPSGSVNASAEDLLVTRQIVEAGELLDGEILGHLMLS